MKNLIITVVVLAAFVAGYWLYQQPLPATPPTLGTPPPPAAGSQAYEIVMDANGFTPVNLTVKVGDRVVFKNADSRSRWPASGLHPTHQLCLGFDALKPMQPGEEYAHVFAEAKECPMHDHLIPSIRGKITITQ